jgi:colanic acid biosynthesis glycosyl transferase WcaI
MNILFFHQHFHPETVGTSTRAVEIVEHLVKRGHTVTVLAGVPSHPSTMRSGEVSRRQPREEEFRGARLVRVWAYGTAKPDTFLRRMLSYGSFMVLGTLRALFLRGKFDAIVAISPLPDGIGGYVVSRFRGIPLMFDVCDIWPDCAIAVGMLRNSALKRMAFWMEKKVYARAIRIGVVTRGFTENIVRKGVPRDKVRLLPDWVDPALYDSSLVDRDAVRAEYGLAGRYIVSFMGNFGLIMGIEQILETARVVMGTDPGVLFLFVGKGVQQPMMEARIREWELTNVRIIPYQPRAKVPQLLAASDALIVTYKKDDITLITVPSKIYEYMSSARPVVAGVDGVIGEILAEAGCGMVSKSRDPHEMAAFISRLRRDPALGAAMGAKGRSYASGHFSFSRVAEDYERAVMETAEVGRR